MTKCFAFGFATYTTCLWCCAICICPSMTKGFAFGCITYGACLWCCAICVYPSVGKFFNYCYFCLFLTSTAMFGLATFCFACCFYIYCKLFCKVVAKRNYATFLYQSTLGAGVLFLTCFGTGWGCCLFPSGPLVSCRRDCCLSFCYRTTYGAMFTFCQTSCCTCWSYCCIYYFGVTSCRN